MNTRDAITHALALALTTTALACDPAPGSSTVPPEAAERAAIDLPGDGLFPEGITVDRDGNLYVTSVMQGHVFRAPARTGQAETFAADLGNGVVGTLADDDRGLLWVCRSNPLDPQNVPAVLTLGLSDGQVRATHPFPGASGFCNDFVIDDDGTVYVSDSWGGRILKIASDDVVRDTEAETWLAAPEFEVPEGTFGVNGMAIDDGTLYVVMYETGQLLRTPIDEEGQPGEVGEVELPRPLGYPDGVRLEAPGRLVVVEGSGSLTRIELDDDTARLQEVLTGLDSPTTVALHDGAAWLPVSQFDHLFGFDTEPVTLPFTVVGVGLE